MNRCHRSPVLFFCLALSVLPALSQQVSAPTPSAGTQLLEERLHSLESEQQYTRQALKDDQDTTRFLITGFGALMLLTQVISSLLQSKREDNAYKKQIKREDELEKRRDDQEKALENSRKDREDTSDARRLQREKQLIYLV
jgi:hypothetical protein